MNPGAMANSLSNSLYNAISPYQEGELSYHTDYTNIAYYSRMDDYQNNGLQESDFMNHETDPQLDVDLFQALAGTEFTPLTNLTEVDMSLLSPHSDLLSSGPQIHDRDGSEGADDSVSDYSDPESCYSDSNYDPTIKPDNVFDYSDSSGYTTDPDLMHCQPMRELVFTPGISHDNPSQKKKPGRKKGQTSKVLHLWEFIRDLLKDPQFNGNIIQWENKQDGVFRVVKSSEVASLWGQKKKNKKEMTYEKMSRSMRYSRKEGYFIDLPKNSGYPKKLCFRFGPKSTGWQ